ncbi:MAG: O-antigen ligase family protein [Gammaproteobacteria bacterium]|nr:O-antigen ligase family protein [Gammaproteobacteria bacterium]
MVDTSRLLYWPVALGVFLAPIVMLQIPHGSGASYLLLASLGVLTPFVSRYRPFSQDEKRLFTVVGAFCAVALVSYLLSDMNYLGFRKLGRYVRLLAVIPVAYIFVRARLTQGWLWYGVAAGALLAGVVAMIGAWDASLQGRDHYRAGGSTGPILYGDLALAMGFIALAGMGYFHQQGRWQVLMPLVGVAMGLLASLLSGTRGGWIALPALALLCLWFYWKHLQRWQCSTLLMLLLVIPLAAWMIPQTGVKTRVEEVRTEIAAYLDGTNRDTSIGHRFELWRAAWQMFENHPLFGAGVGADQEAIQAQIRAGERHEGIAHYQSPHSEYLSVLASRGLVGFVVLILLFLVPAWTFYRAARTGSADVARLGLAGLVVVVAFMHFGLTDAILDRVPPIHFYGLFLALLTYLISSLEYDA